MWKKGLILGIFIMQFIGICIVPLTSGISTDHHIFSQGRQHSGEKYNQLDSKLIFIKEETGFFRIKVSGNGFGLFFPPRFNRGHFVCIIAVIHIGGLFDYAEINNETHYAPLTLFFTGLSYVTYTKYILRDSIYLWGFSLHRPLIL